MTWTIQTITVTPMSILKGEGVRWQATQAALPDHVHVDRHREIYHATVIITALFEGQFSTSIRLYIDSTEY